MTDFLKRRIVLVALFALNVPWIIGFAVIESLLDSDERQDENQAAQVQRNGAENDCQTAYAAALTDALQDRDAVATISREGLRQWVKSEDANWATFARLVQSDRPSAVKLRTFLASIEKHHDNSTEYLQALQRVTRTASINPYPDLAGCLDQLDEETAEALAIQLSSHASERPHGQCRGKRVTIQGTVHGDVIHGTDGPDVIRSGKGVDLVSSGAGRDRVCSGNGSDIVNAGRGFDRVNCGRGMDWAQQAERKRSC